MSDPYAAKSTVEEIRQRFDADVERFSNLDTGQAAILDAPLMLELISRAAATVSPRASAILDIGCGAGNYTLKLLERVSPGQITLVDLSRPMLDRAAERIRTRQGSKAPNVTTCQSDIRELALGEQAFDIVMAASVLHHLRGDDQWHEVFARIARSVRPGGSFWIADLVAHDDSRVEQLMREQYGDYLRAQGGDEYVAKVFAYVEREDTPRSVTFQLELLRQYGFDRVEVLHKRACFAAFGGIKR